MEFNVSIFLSRSRWVTLYCFIKVSALSIREMMSGRLMPEGGAADAADITEGLRDGDELDFDGFVRAVSGAERSRSTG